MLAGYGYMSSGGPASVMKNAPADGDGQMGGEDEGAVMYMHRAVLQPHGSLAATVAWAYASHTGCWIAHALSISPPRQEREILLMRTKHVNQSTSNGNLNKAYI